MGANHFTPLRDYAFVDFVHIGMASWIEGAHIYSFERLKNQRRPE
jgi:hypothetical protein